MLTTLDVSHFHAFLSKLNLHDVLGVTYVVSFVPFFLLAETRESKL